MGMSCWFLVVSVPQQTVFKEEQYRDWNKTVKLRSMDLRRWSSVINLIGSVLASIIFVNRTYYKRAKLSPLRGMRDSMEQQYSILKPVHRLIQDAQGGGFTGPMFLLNLMDALHGGVMDLQAPLRLYDPATSAPLMVNGKPKEVAAADLTPMAARTRELLREGVRRRFLEGRYTGGEKKASFIWDAAAMAHPAYAGRLWVDEVIQSEGKGTSEGTAKEGG